MSFEDSPGSRLKEYEPTDVVQPAYSDNIEFTHLAAKFSDKLLHLTSDVGRLSQQVTLLATRRETPQVRERVRLLLDETGAGFKDLAEDIRTLSSRPDLNLAQRFTQQKLNRELQSGLARFQQVQRVALQKSKKSADAARAALKAQQNVMDSDSLLGNKMSDVQAESSHQFQLQKQQPRQQEQTLSSEQLASQEEVDFHQSLILERESEIRNMEQSVTELMDIFKDVAHIIQQQGDHLDTIADNIESIQDDTQGAHVELVAAARYQKRSRNKACCLLVTLAIILTIVILAVVVS